MTIQPFHSLLVLCFVALASGASVTFYGDSEFSSVSTTVTSASGLTACYTLPANWRNTITSFTTSGAEGITVYDNINCEGDLTSFFAPTRWMGDIWNDRMDSFKFIEKITETTPPAAPVNDPSYGVCKAVLIVDNYIVRGLKNTLSMEQITRKYRTYFADIDAYYLNNFNIHLSLDYIFAEESSSFTDTTNATKLLDDFQLALFNKAFGASMPTQNICFYHLLTGRQPPGTAGLASVGSLCSGGYGNVGYAVDAGGTDDAGIVVRRSIHEIGHNFGGNHPDVYQQGQYTCNVNDDLGVYRILRATPVQYRYLESGTRISECATQAINSRLTSYTCLYTANPTTIATVTFYNDNNYGGSTYVVAPRRGTATCYNILPFNDVTSSIAASSSTITQIIGYADLDCLNSTITLTLPRPSMPSGWNDFITSFKFVISTSNQPFTTSYIRNKQAANAQLSRVLDGTGNQNGHATLQDQASVNGRLWNFDGTYIRDSNTASNLVLDMFGTVASGATVGEWTINNGANQQWYFDAAGTNYGAIHPASNRNLCLDASGGGTSAGTSVVVWTCNGGDNQLWSRYSA